MPVAMATGPALSRFTRTRMSVSLVLRKTVATRVRAAQLLDDGSPRRAVAAVGAHAQSLQPQVGGQLQVGIAIADDVTVARVERVVAQVVGEQAGLGLAARTAIGGAVRAEELGVELDALRREECANEVLRLAEGGLGERRRAEPVLVADQHEAVARLPQFEQGRDDTGQQSHLGHAVDLFVGRLFDQRAVAVDEQDVLRSAHARSTAASSRSFCAGVPIDTRRHCANPGYDEKSRTMSPASLPASKNRRASRHSSSRKLASEG